MAIDRTYYVYILASRPFGTLYVGMTKDLRRRMAEHRQEVNPGFTQRYDVKRLVYVETFDSPYRAIAREKQLKAGSRQRKINLILQNKKAWEDLAESLFR